MRRVQDLATLTFDLGFLGACRWYGSSSSVCVPSLNFVGLLVRKILGIYCVSINPPGDLDFWPLNPKIVPFLVYPKVIPYIKFEHFGIIRFWVMLRTNRQTNRETDWLKKFYPRRPTVGVGNDLLCVKWDVKLCSVKPQPGSATTHTTTITTFR